MFLSREEKETRVIELYSQGKTTRDITKLLSITKLCKHRTKEEEKNNSIVTDNKKP